MEQLKVVLADHEIPKQWYNIQADLPKPMSPPSTRVRGNRSGRGIWRRSSR